MTEERKLEPAEKIHGDCMFRGAVHQHDVVQQTRLILCTVVTEAQEERRKELVEARELLREIEAIADNEAVVVMCQNYFEQLKERG